MKSFLSGPFRSDDVRFSAGVDVGDLVYADASALDLPRLHRVDGALTIADETRICLERLQQTLAQAGCTLADIVKMNCYLTEDAFRTEFWETFDSAFAPGPNPDRLTQVGGLAGEARVLLDAVAAR